LNGVDWEDRILGFPSTQGCGGHGDRSGGWMGKVRVDVGFGEVQVMGESFKEYGGLIEIYNPVS
jgi:hypothetical protein